MTGEREIELALSDVDHLFNAPDVDPYSKSEPEVLGVAGIDYLMNYLHIDRKRLQSRKLTLIVPASQGNVSAAEITEGLHRVANVRLMRDGLELRNIYRYGWRVALVSVIMLAICLGISHLFVVDDTTKRPLLFKTFEYGFEIVGWVLLWHPVDVLVFNPLVVRYRMRSLRTLAQMEVAIKVEGS